MGTVYMENAIQKLINELKTRSSLTDDDKRCSQQWPENLAIWCGRCIMREAADVIEILTKENKNESTKVSD